MATPAPPQPPAQQPPPSSGVPPERPGAPGIAIAGFVCGLIGLILSFFGWGIILAIIGVVLSIIGRRKAAELGAPQGLATAGLIMGIIGIVIGILIFALVIWASDEIDDFADELSTTTFELNFVIGALLLRDKVIAPIRRIRG